MADWQGKLSVSMKAVLFSLAVSLVFPVSLLLVLSPLIQKAINAESTEEAFRVARYLSSYIDTADPRLIKDEFPDEALRLKESFGLYRICVISSDGVVIFSSDGDMAGKSMGFDLFGRWLSGGARYSDVRKSGDISLMGDTLKAQVIESYTPIMSAGRVMGAVGVMYDITQVHSDLRVIKNSFSLVLFVISFALFLLLSVLLTRAERRKILQARAEEDLLSEKLRAETVFSSLGDNIIIQDRDYKVIYQNRINREGFGDKRGEYCYKAYEGRDEICDGCPVELSYVDGGIHKCEKEVRVGDKSIYYELTSSPLRDPTGNIIAGIKLVRDITEKRLLEEQLRHSQKMEAVGTLTSGISHEFNNILTTIVGLSEMLLEQIPEGDEHWRYLDAIYTSGLRAGKLTSGLLAYSRKQITNMRPEPLNGIVRSVEGMLSHVIAVDHGMRVSLSGEEPVVMADRNQIEQVLLNVINNARDAMPTGGHIEISTMSREVNGRRNGRHMSEIKAGRYGLVRIKDSGQGMDSSTVEKIFEPFFTTKPTGHGTGLGLSIVYGIVTQHGGFVDVKTSAGQGTEFMIYLPEAGGVSMSAG